ncbi:MAG: cytochrome c [Nitrospirae bacterium]|nr:cytochrome c [Nitrospirota bacterium]
MSRGAKIAVLSLTAVLFVVFSLAIFAAESLAADAANGKKVFTANCVVCHGDQGNGSGPAAATMTPKPRNFTSPTEMKDIDDARLKKSITEGRPGTAMVGFAKTLKASDIDDVIAYVKTFLKK